MQRHRYPKPQKNNANMQSFRLSILMAFVVVSALILILRLGYLQLAQFKRFATLSLKNQMSIVPLDPPRGVILDRFGVILAENQPIYGLEITPERVKNLEALLSHLQMRLPSITNEDIALFHKERRQHPSYASIPIKIKLNPEEVATFASHQYEFPGVTIKAQLMRHYPMGPISAHVVGYVGRINVQELKTLEASNYQATHFIGKSGIEKYYETTLHGQVGYQQVETDVSGRTLRVLSKQPPVSGQQLSLTLDARLQTIAYEALNHQPGAVVLMNVRNGDVLALVSTPSFDPNIFVNGINQNDYQKLAQDPSRPLYHRAIRGLYPPASTIKPYMALAGLEKDAIDPNTHIYDPGWYRLPGITHMYRDWKRTGHGVVNLKRAIMVSCDTYFYQLGHKMGINAMEDVLLQFGFGQSTHLDLSEEASGLMPSPHWKHQNKGLPWYPGDTLITSIGQGYMLATPMQIASSAATLSMRGQRIRPHLFNHSIDDEGLKTPYHPVKEYPVQLKNQDYWDWVIDAMHAVITQNEGTGYRFGRNAPYTVAGKTGTAQVFSLSQNDKKKYTNIPAALKDHSLFIAFAPIDQPEIAIATLVEHDVTAAHIARVVMDAYFDLYHKKSPHEHDSQ